MNKFLISITALFLGLATLAACSESFLDGPAQGVLDEAILSNEAGVEAALVATYSMLDGFAGFGGWSAAGSNYVLGSMASDDAYKGSEPGDQQPMSDVELYQWGTGNVDGYFNDKWRVLYEAVNRANATLNLMAKVPEISDDTRKRIEGEARFLRAHYHFDAYQNWGNIPYYTEADEDFRKTNVGTDALPLIIADMQAAIELLPETQDAVGRATKWTAKAYLGKLHVWAEDYAAARTVLNDVYDNGPYALQDCFHDVFSVAGDNGTETVLAYQASVNDGDGNGENGNRHDRLNFPHSGSPFGCCGFHQPSQNLVNAFKVDDAGLPLLDGSFDDADVVTTDLVDPRLDWTAGRDGVPFLDWGLHAPEWIRDRAWAGPFSPKKSIYEQGSGGASSVGWANYQLHSQNTHLYRYADVLLFLAEAEVEGGSLERAREVINLLRERAGNCAQGPDSVSVSTTIDDPAIDWASYKVEQYTSPWTDQATARTAVRFERRLELAMEGNRLYDLRRWGVAADVLNAYVDSEKARRNYLTSAATFSDRHKFYPIPIVQIELSELEGQQTLVQNPGW